MDDLRTAIMSLVLRAENRREGAVDNDALRAALAQPEQQAEKTCQQCYDEGVRHGAEAERERCAKLCRSLMPPEGVIRRTLLDLERSILDGDAT